LSYEYLELENVRREIATADQRLEFLSRSVAEAEVLHANRQRLVKKDRALAKKLRNDSASPLRVSYFPQNATGPPVAWGRRQVPRARDRRV
jgi:hypothetical protein